MFLKSKDMLRKAKNNNHPTNLSRWKAQKSYRTSLEEHGIGQKEIMLYDQFALEKHDCTATKAERTRCSQKWVLSMNAEGFQLLRQRPDYEAAKKRMSATTRRVYGRNKAALQTNSSEQTNASKSESAIRRK